MVTAQEITVALNSQGAEKAQDDIEGVEKSFESASGEVGKSADELSGFAGKFKGAMTAIIAGLAVGAAGLLSQVPVVGELFSGLAAVFEGVVFQIDKKLRPAISPLTDELYDLSNAIFEGDWEGAKKEIKDFADELGKIDFSAGAQDIADFAINTLDEITTTFNEKSKELETEDFQGAVDAFLDTFRNSVEKAIEEIDWSKTIINLIKLLGKAILGSAKAFVNNMSFPIQTVIFKALTQAFNDAKEWAINTGEGIINSIIKGIRNKADKLISIIKSVLSGDLSVIEGAGAVLSLGVGSGPEEPDSYDFSGVSGGGGGSQIDGRRLDESTGRYGKDRSTRRSGVF